MIIKFKLFENINEGEPQIGDYVICEDETAERVRSFMHNRIGLYVKLDIEDNEKYYLIKYKNVPEELIVYFNNYGKNTRYVYRHEIKYWSTDKEDLEMILATKDFNL